MKAGRSAMMTARMRLLEKLLKLAIRASASHPLSSLDVAPRKLLAIKLSGLGDAVMVRSLIEHLREHDPRLKIGVLSGPSTMEALSCASDFQTYCYHPRESGMRQVVSLLWRIRNDSYDALIDFEPYSMLTAAFGRATGIKCRIGFEGLDGSPRAKLFTHSIGINDQVRFWDNFVRLSNVIVPVLGPTTTMLPLPVTNSVERWIDNWLERQAPGLKCRCLIALHLGAAQRMTYRCWPVENFVKVANLLRDELPTFTIILTGTPPESELANKFMTRYPGPCVNATSLESLERTTALLRRCRLLISNDTGIMHLGAALGIRTLGLFGASNPAHWAPEGPRASYLYTTKIECSPCIDVYHRKAPSDCFNLHYQNCMSDISPAVVSEAALRCLNDRSA